MSTIPVRGNMRMNMKVIGYWTTTAVVAGVLLFGGVMALLHGPEVLVGQFFIQAMHHLGYPLYLLTILGCWKLLGAIALLVPRFPRRKRMGICWHLLRYDRCSSIVCSEWRERGYSHPPHPRCSHARFVGASPAKPDPGSPVLGLGCPRVAQRADPGEKSGSKRQRSS